MVSRWRHEVSSLHAVQSAAWHNKLHELAVDYWTRGLDHPGGGPVDHPAGGAMVHPDAGPLDHPAGCPVAAVTEYLRRGLDHPGGGAVDPVPVVGVADPAITHKFFGRATAVTALHQPSAPPTIYQHLT